MALDYDNSAFYYFALTLLSLFLIPGTWHALVVFYEAFAGCGVSGSKARTSTEQEKANKLKAATTGVARLKQNGFSFFLVLLVVAWLLFLYLISLVITDGEVNTFDPYVILGIEQGMAVGEIKKAYRKLSLKYHPDKNVGSKVAEEMFMKIAKAYEALTDEDSKENYEKFGNPDGKQALEVSIGLPRVLLDHPKVVLVLYLLSMVVVIPVSVGIWYANSKQFGDANIRILTLALFYHHLKPDCKIRSLPELLALSNECNAINKASIANAIKTQRAEEEKKQLDALLAKFKSEKVMAKPKFEDNPLVSRGSLLLHAHMLRETSYLSTLSLKSNLDQMLVRAPELIEAMIQLCHEQRWFEATMQTLRFSQCIVQASWYSGINSHPLKQLPHLNEEDLRVIAKALKALDEKNTSETCLAAFLRLPEDQKPGLDKLSSAAKSDVLATCKLLPCLDVTYKLFTEEEEEDFYDIPNDDNPGKPGPAPEGKEPSLDQIFERDLLTLRVIVNRRNVTEGSKAPDVLAPFFPSTLQENWWLILTDKVPPKVSEASNEEGGEQQQGIGRREANVVAPVQIHAVAKVSEQDKTFTHELRFFAPEVEGSYEYQLHVVSDCYIGLDEKIDLPFTVLPQADLPEYLPHPEDVELDNEPSLFEQVMSGNYDEAESSDDEGDEATTSAGGTSGKNTKEKKEGDEDEYADSEDEEDD